MLDVACLSGWLAAHVLPRPLGCEQAWEPECCLGKQQAPCRPPVLPAVPLPVPAAPCGAGITIGSVQAMYGYVYTLLKTAFGTASPKCRCVPP